MILKTPVIILIGSLLALSFYGCNSEQMAQNNYTGNKKTRIMLIGASIGDAWDLRNLPVRSKDADYDFESWAIYQFDKTDALDEILMRPKRKFHLTRTYIKSLFLPPPQRPQTIILKECGSYFPGDMVQYEQLIKNWVKKVRNADVNIVLATVPPVTRERASKKEGQIEGIWEFNTWIRQYSAQEHIPLLDIEKILRISENNRYLSDDLTNGDGLHLNKKAYDKLDTSLLNLLSTNNK